jgi:DNA invertase Pin-like site-specific DNA recombinase
MLSDASRPQSRHPGYFAWHRCVAVCRHRRRRPVEGCAEYGLGSTPNAGSGIWYSSSHGRLLSTLFAAIAEFERDLIKERTGEGRKRAQANGVKFGRKPKLSEYQRQEAIKRRAAGETLVEIAKSYAVDVSMISRLN